MWNSGCWSISGNTIPGRHLFTRKEGSKISSTFSSITIWSAHAECWDSVCILDNLQHILSVSQRLAVGGGGANPKISEWRIMSAWRWRKKNPTMRWWECVPDRHRDEFQMQALASGEIPRFIESQKMKTCKNGGEEGRRGKVKCTHSPLESYLRFFPRSFFPIFFLPSPLIFL